MPKTHLRPEHIGEPLISKLFGYISENDRLNSLSCYSARDRCGKMFSEVISTDRFKSNLKYHANVPLANLICSGKSTSFDGLSQVDCLLEDGKKGIAIEVKLGLSRMNGTEFSNRFLSSCSYSDHVPPRVKGNMIAILDGRFYQPELANVALTALITEGKSLPLISTWFLVIRRKVWDNWKQKSPTFNRPCFVVLFEDLVPAVGGAKQFDNVVKELVGDQFASVWGIC